MTGGLVVDTHAILWYLASASELSSAARAALLDATLTGDTIWVPSICLVETIYLTEKGKIPAEGLERLLFALAELSPGYQVAPLDWRVGLAVRQISRQAVPDMPDRIIAATALSRSLPLVTRDARIKMAGGIATIW